MKLTRIRAAGRMTTTTCGVTAALWILLGVSLPASAQSPYVNAINAAKTARAATEAADRKNAEALNPQGAKPAPAPPPAPATAEQTPAEGGRPASGGYTYDPSGRRDPFVSLLGRGGDALVSGANRPSGLPGVLINEVSVKGTFKSDKGLTALLQTPDNKTYIVRTGDKLLDGSVKAVTQDAVVFSQDVNDPLSLVKQREVRKSIRPEGR